MTAGARKLTLFSLAWPIFVEQGLHILVGTVDTFMVAHVSDAAVAAVERGGQVLFFWLNVFNFVGIGSSIVLTHALGAKDRARADRVARAGIAVNTWIGLGVSVLIFAFSRQFLGLLQLPAELIPIAMQFLPLMGGTLFLEAQNIAMGAVLRAHGYTKDPMWITAAQNVLNVVGNCLLLFGLLGFPKLGVMGVALSGVASRLVAFVANWILVRRRTGVRVASRDYVRFPMREVWRILHIGAPAAGENICWWVAFMTVSTFVSRMGAQHIAAQAYTMQVSMWVILFGIAVGLGTEILVGHHVGAGRFEDAYHELLRSMRAGFVLVCIAIVPIAAFAPAILRTLFTQDAAVVGMGAVLLRMALILEPGRVFNVVVISSLRATGDSRFPLYMGFASMWGLWVPLAWLLGLKLGWGLPGVWISMMADEWLRAVIMYRRWKKRRWLVHAQRSRAHAQETISELAAV
jgi:putative MATE family efflux protein